MIAALFYKKGDIRVEDYKNPSMGEFEIVLKTEIAALCGTDVRMYQNGHKLADEKNPLILGHEFSGIITRCGSNVKDLPEGTRVAVAPNFGCGVCDLCVSGNTHLCSDYKAFGISMHGGLAEYVKIPEQVIRQGNIVKIPENVSFEEAALAEPLSCVYNAFERAEIKLGDNVLILGAGPIGLMHAMMAKKGGASKVILSDLSDNRLSYAGKLDNTYYLIHIKELKEKINYLTEGKGVDVCITANPSPKAQIAALELTAVNGRVSFFGGIPANADLSGINTNLIHYRQLKVSGTTRQSLIQFRKVLKLIADKVIDVNSLITDVYDISQVNYAIQNMIEAKGVKHIVRF